MAMALEEPSRPPGCCSWPSSGMMKDHHGHDDRIPDEDVDKDDADHGRDDERELMRER